MRTDFDDKGKFFTHIITKDPVQATIQTLTHRVEGTVHIRRGDRIIDELTAAGEFLAVTEAVVYNSTGKAIYHSDFLTINRDHIVWLMPFDEKGAGKQNSGGQD